MDASVKPLLETVSTPEFEDSGWLALTAVTWEGNDVTLNLLLHKQAFVEERWSLHCKSARSIRISKPPEMDRLAIESEHPVLLPHTKPRVELYFSGRSPNADAVVGQLVEAHREVVGAWFDCLDFFNVNVARSLRTALEGGFGKLAEGPQPLIDRYAKVLQHAGLSVSSPPVRPPVW